MGGTHFLLEERGEVVSCASVVPRELQVHGHSLRTGYVEAVATRVDVQGRGHGTRLMRDVNKFIRAAYQLGALSTGSGLLRAPRLGTVAGIDGREDAARSPSRLPTTMGDHGATDACNPASGSARHDQLRMAPRGRLVTRYRCDVQL